MLKQEIVLSGVIYNASIDSLNEFLYFNQLIQIILNSFLSCFSLSLFVQVQDFIKAIFADSPLRKECLWRLENVGFQKALLDLPIQLKIVRQELLAKLILVLVLQGIRPVEVKMQTNQSFFLFEVHINFVKGFCLRMIDLICEISANELGGLVIYFVFSHLPFFILM